MLRKIVVLAAVCIGFLAGCATVGPMPDRADLQRQVADTERAFAKTMADRDHAAFSRFVSEEALFFSGAKVLRGRTAVAAAWKRLYEGPAAPFS